MRRSPSHHSPILLQRGKVNTSTDDHAHASRGGENGNRTGQRLAAPDSHGTIAEQSERLGGSCRHGNHVSQIWRNVGVFPPANDSPVRPKRDRMPDLASDRDDTGESWWHG